MNIHKIAFKSASLLTTATAAFWVASAVAAPLAPAYRSNSVAGLTSVIQDPAPADEAGSNAGLAADLQRQVVDYPTAVAPGTIVIDTAHTYLFYVLSDGKAIRYGIGVGRDGFAWSGSQAVTRKAEWPDWTPPQEMIARQPYLPRWVAGGEGNPLGARAMYLGSTVYRIHGTNAPETIGTKVSSGCIRLLNADVIDLYSRVTVGTQVIVLPNHGQVTRTAASEPVRIAAPRTADLRATRIY
jgi:lipoprotein-anchoring transpeptidase ErfK/SrfK